MSTWPVRVRPGTRGRSVRSARERPVGRAVAGAPRRAYACVRGARPASTGRECWFATWLRPHRGGRSGCGASRPGSLLCSRPRRSCSVWGGSRTPRRTRERRAPLQPLRSRSPKSPSRCTRLARCGTWSTEWRRVLPDHSGRPWSTAPSRSTPSPRFGCGREKCCAYPCDSYRWARSLPLRAGLTPVGARPGSTRACSGGPVHRVDARLPLPPHVVVTLVLFAYRWGSLRRGRGGGALLCDVRSVGTRTAA